jgi:hypothetical protein
LLKMGGSDNQLVRYLVDFVRGSARGFSR